MLKHLRFFRTCKILSLLSTTNLNGNVDRCTRLKIKGSSSDFCQNPWKGVHALWTKSPGGPVFFFCILSKKFFQTFPWGSYVKIPHHPCVQWLKSLNSFKTVQRLGRRQQQRLIGKQLRSRREGSLKINFRQDESRRISPGFLRRCRFRNQLFTFSIFFSQKAQDN